MLLGGRITQGARKSRLGRLGWGEMTPESFILILPFVPNTRLDTSFCSDTPRGFYLNSMNNWMSLLVIRYFYFWSKTTTVP